MIFMIRHYYIDTRLMQIRPACPASTASMSSTTSIRPRLLFLANFIDFCELGHSSGISLSKLRGCHKYQDRRGPEECQNLRSLNVMRNVRTQGARISGRPYISMGLSTEFLIVFCMKVLRVVLAKHEVWHFM